MCSWENPYGFLRRESTLLAGPEERCGRSPLRLGHERPAPTESLDLTRGMEKTEQLSRMVPSIPMPVRPGVILFLAIPSAASHISEGSGAGTVVHPARNTVLYG